jgi:hypothetical protein
LLSKSLAASAIVLALISLPVVAEQSGELARLREEAAALRQSLDRVNARIQALENQNQDPALGKTVEPPPVPPAPPASVQPIVSLKQNWSQVERGIPQDKVQSLLGQPEKVLHIDGNTVWYYTYPGIGRGSVFFSGNGKVSSTQSPGFGWGW